MSYFACLILVVSEVSSNQLHPHRFLYQQIYGKGIFHGFLDFQTENMLKTV